MAEAGVDLAVMQALLGHTHVDTTARYIWHQHMSRRNSMLPAHDYAPAPEPPAAIYAAYLVHLQRRHRGNTAYTPSRSVVPAALAAGPSVGRCPSRKAVGCELLDPPVHHLLDGQQTTATTWYAANSAACDTN
jgi:hypothetical protein